MRLGEILIRNAALDPDKLEEALAQQEERGERIGEVLIGLRAVT